MDMTVLHKNFPHHWNRIIKFKLKTVYTNVGMCSAGKKSRIWNYV